MSGETLITVVTSKRPGDVDYLTQTLERIEACGGKNFERWLVCDGTYAERPSFPGWNVFRVPGGPHGTRTMMWTAFEIFAARRGERLLYLEDDLTLCRNAISYAADFEYPGDMGLVTFFDPRHLPGGASPGLYGHSLEHFWCSQFISMEKPVVKFLLQYDPCAYRQPDWAKDGRNSSDSVMGHLLRYEEPSAWRRFGVHIPCLADHVGAASIVDAGKPGVAILSRGRRASNYPGDLFDAADLPLDLPLRIIERSHR